MKVSFTVEDNLDEFIKQKSFERIDISSESDSEPDNTKAKKSDSKQRKRDKKLR